MVFLKSVAVIIVVLIALNGFFGGAIGDGVKDMVVSEEKQDVRNSMKCLAGLYMYYPVKDISGLTVPMPSWTNVIVAAFLTSVFVKILHYSHVNYNWKHTIGIYVAVWLLYKLVGYIFIMNSGDGCELFMTNFAESLSGVGIVGGLVGLFMVWKNKLGMK
jgi:hypothetical protein